MTENTENEVKSEFVWIECEIPIGRMYGANEQDKILHQLSELSFCIDALGWFMGTLTKVAQDMEIWEKPELPEGFDKDFRVYSLQIGRIIQGLSSQITEYTSDLHHLARKETAKEEKAKQETGESVLDLSNHVTAEDECIDLAKHLSAVLKDEKTPTALYNAIVDGLGSIDLPKDYLDSPEYLQKILCREAPNE